MQARFGAAAVPSCRPDLQTLMRAFGALNSPRLTADQLCGPYTEDDRYFSRRPLPGCSSDRALVLEEVCWLDVGGEFQVRFRRK